MPKGTVTAAPPLGPNGECTRCPNPHLTVHGNVACLGHRAYDGPGVKLPEPVPCRNPPSTGQRVCRYHGGAAAQAKAKAARTVTEAALIATARKLIPDADDRTPITNPLERLLDLASEADAFRESLRMLTNKLGDNIRYVGTGTAQEQLRAEVATYRQALKDVTDLLVAIAKLDIEKTLARIESRKVEMTLDAMSAGCTDAGLSDEQKRVVMAGVARHLRSVPRRAA